MCSLQADREQGKTFSTGWLKLWKGWGKKAIRYKAVIHTYKIYSLWTTLLFDHNAVTMCNVSTGCGWLLSNWTRSQPCINRLYEEHSRGESVICLWFICLSLSLFTTSHAVLFYFELIFSCPFFLQRFLDVVQTEQSKKTAASTLSLKAW